MRLKIKTLRLRRVLFAAVLTGPTVVAASMPAGAAVITAEDILTQINGVFSGTFKGASDVEGRLVAGTINQSSSSTFYNNPKGAPSSFQAINALNITSCPSCNVDNSGNVNWINSNSGAFSFNGGGSARRNDPAFAMSDFTTPLNALETQLAALSPNSVATLGSNNLTFNETPVNGLAVFKVSIATLESATNLIQFSHAGAAATTIIIDVTGTGSFQQNANFNDDSVDSSAIWNFEDATSLNLRSWHGAVLAGDASVTNSSQLNGFLYAASSGGSNNGELHDHPFDGTIPSATPGVPEPSTWAMMLIGFAGLGFAGYRRRKAKLA